MSGYEEGHWTDEEGVKALAEQLRPHVNTGAMLRIDNDCFGVQLPGREEIPEEDENAKPGDPLHWKTLEDRVEALDLPEIPDADMPHHLTSALALLLGFKAESV